MVIALLAVATIAHTDCMQFRNGYANYDVNAGHSGKDGVRSTENGKRSTERGVWPEYYKVCL